TARVDEIDRLLGLELGADDYICKPFSPREVVARVKAVLRRSLPEFQEEKLVLGPITIKSDSHRVIIGDTDLRLTPVEFELLRIMASKPFNVFTRSDLISKIKGRNFDGYGRAVDSHIKNLRRKIDELLPGNRIIQTAYGMGYFISVYQTIKD
ncbi:MAG: response regulator transcription factor, partial [Deltaproteobacteria bacterium]|nr:response regulator transcription factor [Deltaproteobacteria bacterium]